MNKIVGNFVKALNEIEQRDFLTQRVVLIDNQINVNGDYYSTYENNFVTKLNEKYALLNFSKVIEEPTELNRQFQIPKKYAYSDISDLAVQKSVEKICDILGKEADPIKELNLIPDFIIHKNENDKSFVNQRLIAEVKTELNLSYKKFVWDFFKLIIYLNKFNFQYAIFLSVNTSKDTILQYVEQYLDNELYLPISFDKLYIIIREDYQSENKIFSLQEISNKNSF